MCTMPSTLKDLESTKAKKKELKKTCEKLLFVILYMNVTWNYRLIEIDYYN